MCGILAIARSEPRPSPAAASVGTSVGADRAAWASGLPIERAMARLARRGPDGHGLALSADGRVLLGHTRLAIQDLSEHGRQPMGDRPENPAALVTFNGEIYNAPALRRELEAAGHCFRSRSDTEVLVRGFCRWGIEGLLSRLCGMFAFVLVDQRDPRRPLVHAAVDPAGMKPLVWRHGGRCGETGPSLSIASDCDALLELLADDPTFDRRLDGASLCHVLSVGYCPAPRTVWRGVNKLRPGEWLTWSPADHDAAYQPPRVTRYWTPPSQSSDPTTDAHADSESFESLFRTIVDEHLLADVPLGLFLSAGLDSSSIALALAQMGRCEDVTAYTLTAAGIDGPLDEAPLAAAFASSLMMRHRSIVFPSASLRDVIRDAAAAFDEPQGFTALLTAMQIARSASERGLKVVLAGDGGDEAFAGYQWHTRESHALSLDPARFPGLGAGWAPAPTGERLASPDCAPAERAAARLALGSRSYTHRYLCRVFPGFHPAESRALLSALEPEYGEDDFAGWLAPADDPQLPHPRRAQRLDLSGFCAGSILPKIDRSAMHVGLELRAPFLDRRVLDYAIARSPDVESDGSKPLLRRLLRRGVESGLVPPAILARPKQGFSLRLAAANPIATLAAEILPHSVLIRDGVLREDYESYLPIDPGARETRLFTLCMLAEWYKRRCK